MPIHIVTKQNSDRYHAEIRQFFEIRHRTFVEGLGWNEIRRADGLERDQFDNSEAIYLLLVEEGTLIGGHRLLPTSGAHLFSDIFPHLCNIRGVFRSNKAYELTRTCVDESALDGRRAVKARLQLMAGLMEFCVATGMECFTVLGRMDVMQKYIRLGWQLRPLGEPIEMDGVRQVAMQVKTDHSALTAIMKSCRIRSSLLHHEGTVSPLEDLIQDIQNAPASKGPFVRRRPAIPESAASDFARDGVVCLRDILDLQKVRSLSDSLDRMAETHGTSKASYDMTDLRQKIFNSNDALLVHGNATQHDIGGIGAFIRSSGKRPLLDGTKGRGHFRLDTCTWRRSDAIRAMALDSILPEVAARLMNAQKVNFYDDQIFIKEPQTVERTAIHQDYPYFHIKGWQGCVMWICVDQATPKSGTPLYIAGSHLWDRDFAPNVFLSQTPLPGSNGDQLDEVEDNLDEYDVRRFDVMPGDVIIHHFRTLHGAGGNLTNRNRRAISLRYIGEDMRYCARPGAPAAQYKSHLFTDGDVLDSPDFPVVWPRPYPGFKLAQLY